jgi:hypothetical protein
VIITPLRGSGDTACAVHVFAGVTPMTTEDPVTKSETGRRPTAGEFSALIREYSPALAGWSCLIIAALVAFRLTEATQYHQLAAGVLMSSSTLFILMALFECLWWMFVERNP